MKQEEGTTGTLIIRLFGGFAVELGGEPLRRLHSPKGLRVLAYLALDPGKTVQKSVLAHAIWPYSENAVDNLNRILSDLRQALGEPLRLFSVGHGRLQLQLQKEDKIDTIFFQQLLQHEDIASLQKAMDLYQGSLLLGWNNPDGEMWIGERRQQYADLFLEAVKRLRLLAMSDRNYKDVLGYLRRELYVGKNDAAGWYDLMQAHLMQRDFENAALVYAYFEGVSTPSRAMKALWEQIPSSVANSIQDKLLLDLPKFFTSFLGREAELLEIQRKLKTAPSRLLLLTGSGGIGKTRLAVALGHRMSGDFAQGVKFVDLTSAIDLDSILRPLCAAFKVPGKQELIRLLQRKELLLILDNCEQVQEACAALIHELLISCPHLYILATSRQVFNIGEIAWEVPCLALPISSKSLAPEGLLQFSAIQLFFERAQAVFRRFELTTANAPAVIEICRRLDGIPLAIELAAVRLKTMTPQEIVMRLSDRFGLLIGGSKNAQQRHQTLRAMVQWSYELLNEDERRLFRRLSVFVGGWTEAAIIKVCAEEGLDSAQIQALLEGLLDKSLVVRGGEVKSRFRMLETIMHYAAEKLADKEEESLCRKKHRDYFLQMVMEINAEQSGQQQAELLNTLDAEYHNLDQALVFCTHYAEEVQDGLRLGAALQEFWWIRGYLSAGRERLRILLKHPNAQEHTQARAAALGGAGALARLQGDFSEARSLHEESLEIFRELKNERSVAYVLGNLGIVVWCQQEASFALSLMQESLELHRKLQNREGIAYCLGNMSNMAGENKDYVSARVWMEESLEILREQKNDVGVANCLGNLGNIAYHLQDYAAAYALYGECLTRAKETEDKLVIAACLVGIIELAFQENETEWGIRLMGAEQQLREQIGSPRPTGSQDEVNRQLAVALQVLGEVRFSSALAEGRAMTWEQAVDYALQKPYG